MGLDYLHHGCKPSIIHRDVKTTNILLGNNLEAKLADFGLSRAFNNDEVSHISTIVAGTLGYLDPEYFNTGKLNEKSDVYSFGIVLLELITGRKPVVEDSTKENNRLVQWVQSLIERGDRDTIADPRLKGDFENCSICKALEIAMACTMASSTKRVTMNEVVMQLKECTTQSATCDEINVDINEMIPTNLGSEPSTI
ncbi:hypothetical protein Taro_047742 [Colocasia esculenta]|uniref:Protein kinase domain-containing protein n=1 Tax=Colocasia esculenta TaxID=4460 RepID=A0A843WTR6_COLES|nr:hypothetical protein [Colocasia esculenta]